MTQSECIVEALRRLGGRASNKKIYSMAFEINKELWGGKTPTNSMRRCLQQCKDIIPCEEKGEGWWQLVSFQEDIAERDMRIAQLTDENEKLKQIESAAHFIDRFKDAMHNLFKRESTVIDDIRKIFVAMGEEEIAESLDQELEKKEKKDKKNLSADSNSGIMAGGNVTLEKPKITLTDAQLAKLIEERKRLNP